MSKACLHEGAGNSNSCSKNFSLWKKLDSGKWSIYQDSDILNWLAIFKVLSDTITVPTSKLRQRARVVLKQLPRKSKKSEKVESTPSAIGLSSEKGENSIPAKIKFNNYFEENGYVIKVNGKEITLHHDVSDFMKLYHKGSIQKIAEYILEKLVDGKKSSILIGKISMLCQNCSFASVGVALFKVLPRPCRL